MRTSTGLGLLVLLLACQGPTGPAGPQGPAGAAGPAATAAAPQQGVEPAKLLPAPAAPTQTPPAAQQLDIAAAAPVQDPDTNPLIKKLADLSPVAAQLLAAAAKGRDLHALIKAADVKSLDPNAHASAQWDKDHGPCGSGVRPYIWALRPPVVGELFILSYDPLGAPRTDNVYDWSMAYVLISLTPPLPTPTVLPGSGCSLWFNPTLGSTVVWGFSGTTQWHDGLMTRETNERMVRCEIQVPAELAGLQAWTQMITLDQGELKSSMVYSITFGALR